MPARERAVFLDRDGVINHDPGDYTRNLSEFHVLPTVIEALKDLSERGYLLIMITNQGGIAKGLYTHGDVQEIHDHFEEHCRKAGVEWTDIYYAPSHPDYGESLMRKPGSMMLERAIARYNIDPTKSFVIGDKQRDLDAGAPLGVKGILIEKNSPLIEAIENVDR